MATEDKMNELIQQEDKENIILYASYGHITENFLKWLLIAKTKKTRENKKASRSSPRKRKQI